MNQNRKLTPTQVRATRRAFSNPSFNAVATIVGVDAKTISDIVGGNSYTGAARSNQKLSMEQANTIRTWFTTGPSYNAVANFIGINSKTVSNIVNGVTYREVR